MPRGVLTLKGGGGSLRLFLRAFKRVIAVSPCDAQWKIGFEGCCSGGPAAAGPSLAFFHNQQVRQDRLAHPDEAG